MIEGNLPPSSSTLNLWVAIASSAPVNEWMHICSAASPKGWPGTLASTSDHGLHARSVGVSSTWIVERAVDDEGDVRGQWDSTPEWIRVGERLFSRGIRKQSTASAKL
jgi:hypothetical protein